MSEIFLEGRFLFTKPMCLKDPNTAHLADLEETALLIFRHAGPALGRYSERDDKNNDGFNTFMRNSISCTKTTLEVVHFI
ncbi:hypothetical protein CEXT_720671 [Caerostris extrusa]|uniref:Uncharacterized protein n=1 Tax=Caerostris extrusa TaxID=172846 RepID=A0AAV4QWN7_CAEEX|nr:hypothetical protein CEXT_720671 [Caerostris extrusa]